MISGPPLTAHCSENNASNQFVIIPDLHPPSAGPASVSLSTQRKSSPLLPRALSCQAAAGADAGSPPRPVKQGRQLLRTSISTIQGWVK